MRKVGIEWEFNGNDDSWDYNPGEERSVVEWKRKWPGAKVKPDGSCGWEAVTPPLAKTKLRRCLSQLGKALERKSINELCGLHVHVNARDYNWPDARRLFKFYARVEPYLYKLASFAEKGQSYFDRRKSDYCQMVGDILIQKDINIVENLAPDAVDGGDCYCYSNYTCIKCLSQRSKTKKRPTFNVEDKYDGDRYYGLNILPWLAGKNKKARDTTFEFRMHRNTKDPNRVFEWACLLSNMVNFCKKNKEFGIPRSHADALIMVSPESRGWLEKCHV